MLVAMGIAAFFCIFLGIYRSRSTTSPFEVRADVNGTAWHNTARLMCIRLSTLVHGCLGIRHPDENANVPTRVVVHQSRHRWGL